MPWFEDRYVDHILIDVLKLERMVGTTVSLLKGSCQEGSARFAFLVLAEE